MGKIRTFSPHIKWNDQEIAIIKDKYRTTSWEELLKLLPNRTKSQIQNKANGLGITRYRKPKLSDTERLKRKRESMAKRRALDPEAVREYHRQRHHKNREENCRKLRDYQKKRFFWMRAIKIKGVTAKSLASVWRKQKGLCALTGRKLDRTAQVDHILPKTRGGTDSLDNIQWVCREANMAKGDMTDKEFVELCQNVMGWIGLRLTFLKK